MTGLRVEDERYDLQDEFTFLGELRRRAGVVVYRARHRARAADVAIKVYAPSRAARDDAPVAATLHHAPLVAPPQHRGFVAVSEIRELADGGVAVIMPYVPMRSLADLVSAAPVVSEAAVEGVLADISAALAFAHNRGVVHRHLTPDSIALELGSGRAVLTDLSLAMTGTANPLVASAEIRGPSAYSAPEEVRSGRVDERSNVFSLGLIAWELLTGIPVTSLPLEARQSAEESVAIPSIESVRPGAVSARMQYIVQRMLQAQPRERWAGAQGVLIALRNWSVTDDFERWLDAFHADATPRVHFVVPVERRPPTSVTKRRASRVGRRLLSQSVIGVAALLLLTDTSRTAAESSTGMGLATTSVARAPAARADTRETPAVKGRSKRESALQSSVAKGANVDWRSASAPTTAARGRNRWMRFRLPLVAGGAGALAWFALVIYRRRATKSAAGANEFLLFGSGS